MPWGEAEQNLQWGGPMGRSGTEQDSPEALRKSGRRGQQGPVTRQPRSGVGILLSSC